MKKRSYEAHTQKRIHDRETIFREFRHTKTIQYSDNIFRHFDANGRGYGFYVDLPPPPKNKAQKCHTLEEAQKVERQLYGKSVLFDEPITHDY